MVSKIRRVAASVPANFAAGYAAETGENYLEFLRVAQESLKELETHILLSQPVRLARENAVEPVLPQCETVGKMLRGLIRSLQK
jgi:four helix bundle protein